MKEKLVYLQHLLGQVKADWDHATGGKKGQCFELAQARDVVEDLIRAFPANSSALFTAAGIKLPVAAQKTTIYTPEQPNFPWLATTCSSVVGQLHNTERDEARAKLIALVLNHHQTLVNSLKEIHDEADHALGTEATDVQEVMRVNLHTIRKIANCELEFLKD